MQCVARMFHDKVQARERCDSLQHAAAHCNTQHSTPRDGKTQACGRFPHAIMSHECNTLEPLHNSASFWLRNSRSEFLACSTEY
mmetsp:Transcript_18830/g.27697  ORF Transcript_18830/g.27697 Transcript_18830/m.27697 type:complete len:84 (-) Transcript_18830:185-436(-)